MFPTDAAEFLLANRPAGHMYNLYGWGGYLLWRLAPAEVFIDGRNSDRALFDAYRAFESGAAHRDVDGVPYWKRMFASYGIRYTVTPLFDQFTGIVSPLLLDYLIPDPDWTAVFIGANSVVFVEDTAENRALIARQAIAKQRVLPTFVERCDELIRSAPGYVAPYVARGDALVYLGRLAEARATYERALARAPGNPVARERLEWLRHRGVY
jgi:tetratricopeptide (TPR) repeat protein